MAKKEKRKEEGGGAPEWMATYGDLVTLLMCFFLLLFAFSEIDAQKFEAVMQSFQGSAGVLEGGTTLSESPLVFNGMPETQVAESPDEPDELQELKEVVEEFLKENEMEMDVLVELETRGLLIRFEDNALFDSGKAVIKLDSVETLTFLSEILKSDEFLTRFIRIEGHTDNVPIRTARFPSNWELSTARASNVVRFFIEDLEMKPDRFSASGYGEYHPVANNESVEGRAENRRVDIVILREIEVKEEPNS